MFIRGEDGETILLTRDRLHPPEAKVPVYTAADSFDESDPYAPPATYTDSSDRRWEVLLVSAPADATVQED